MAHPHGWVSDLVAAIGYRLHGPSRLYRSQRVSSRHPVKEQTRYVDVPVIRARIGRVSFVHDSQPSQFSAVHRALGLEPYAIDLGDAEERMFRSTIYSREEGTGEGIEAVTVHDNPPGFRRSLCS